MLRISLANAKPIFLFFIGTACMLLICNVVISINLPKIKLTGFKKIGSITTYINEIDKGGCSVE